MRVLGTCTLSNRGQPSSPELDGGECSMVLCSAAVDVDAGDGRRGEPEKRASPRISSSQRETITAGQERAGDGSHHRDKTTSSPRPLYLLRKTTSRASLRSPVVMSPSRRRGRSSARIQRRAMVSRAPGQPAAALV